MSCWNQQGWCRVETNYQLRALTARPMFVMGCVRVDSIRCSRPLFMRHPHVLGWKSPASGPPLLGTAVLLCSPWLPQAARMWEAWLTLWLCPCELVLSSGVGSTQHIWSHKMWSIKRQMVLFTLTWRLFWNIPSNDWKSFFAVRGQKL